MNKKIYFADISHSGHFSSVPLGLASVMAYVMKHCGERYEMKIFKNTNKYLRTLEGGIPEILCFSNFVWNQNLNLEISRRVKEKSPKTVIVFGGPNYPVEKDEQKKFLQKNTCVDFYIFREGERTLLELLLSLEKEESVKELKIKRKRISGCHYMQGDDFIIGELLPKIKNIEEEFPSCYLSGLCDEFLLESMVPLLQFTRGCPFTCTYCQEGDNYFNHISRYSLQRIKEELEYVAGKSKNPNLIVADSNFGMYQRDIDVSRLIADIQNQYGWPETFFIIQGKNNKERILEAASIIKGAYLSTAIQSSDEKVLENIRRKNVSLETIIHVAREAENYGAKSFSEVILCLPGDTKKAHMKSVTDLIDSGIKVVRSHQFILLLCSEAAARSEREKYDMVSKFRIYPNTADPYRFLGSEFVVPEIDEICVGNSTMSFEDYLECRAFDLSIEIFYNDNVFYELIQYLKITGISTSAFIRRLHKGVRRFSEELSRIYKGFIKENCELYNTLEDAEKFIEQPEMIQKYQEGELGNNEQLIYRAMAIFRYMKDLHQFAFHQAREMLIELKGEFEDYLEELYEYSLCRKSELLSKEKIYRKEFHYDFVALEEKRFKTKPSEFYREEKMRLEFFHTQHQSDLLSKYLELYGDDMAGLGVILSNASNIHHFYRKTRLVSSE